MNRLIRSEIRKLTTTRWFKLTMAISVAMAPLSAAVNALTAKTGAGVRTDELIHHTLAVSAFTSIVLLGVGIAAMAGEFRHGTSVPTFLITPRRRAVVVAKLVTVTGLGAIVGAVSFGLAVAAAVPALTHHGIHHLAGDTGQMWVGATVVTALFGTLGVALGAITRNMIIAIIGAIGWTFVIEGSFLAPLVPSIGKWLPAGANMAITHTGNTSSLLDPSVAVGVLAIWVIGFVWVATTAALHRDV